MEKLKEEAPNQAMWRTRFERRYGPVLSQTTKRRLHYFIILVQTEKRSIKIIYCKLYNMEGLLFFSGFTNRLKSVPSSSLRW
jgi:hypothetical protein